MGWSDGGSLAKLSAGTLTFLAVVVGWVFFRADSFTSAVTILHGMAGMNGILKKWVPVREALKLVLPCLMCVFFFPNVRQLFQHYRPTCEDIEGSKQTSTSNTLLQNGRLLHFLQWQPTKIFAWMTGVVFLLSINELTHVSEFLYFQF